MNMEDKILQIPVEDIIPNRFQPRINFDDQALQELATSIKQHGIIQPLVLRKLGDKYEIIAGERRYKASQLAGLSTVPAVISNIDDDKSAEVALVENIQRRNLTSIEEAKSYKNLLDRGYLTQEQLAEKMGVSQSTIANKLRLLNLADEVQEALMNEKISERHARALLSLKDKDEQVKWLNKILNDRLTVRQLDIEMKKLNNDEDSSIPIVNLTPNINEIKENALDINPAQGLHDIESMLKPSTPGEKVYDLNLPVENVETLDIDTPIVDNSKDIKPQNKFFNFLEDEVANMNEDASIDDIFTTNPNANSMNASTPNILDTVLNDNSSSVQDEININPINENISPLENLNSIPVEATENIQNDTSSNSLDFMNNFIGNENTANNTINENINTNDINIDDNSFNVQSNTNNIDTNQLNESPITNDISIDNNTSNDTNSSNQFFNFNPFNNNEPKINDVESENILESNNQIEEIHETKQPDVFDPMSMVNTLEPDYQEKQEEAQGIDLKTAINSIRELKNRLESRGFNLTIDEADLENSYSITINIIK